MLEAPHDAVQIYQYSEALAGSGRRSSGDSLHHGRSGMKTAVLKLATDYDKLAERAERRTLVKPVGTHP